MSIEQQVREFGVNLQTQEGQVILELAQLEDAVLQGMSMEEVADRLALIRHILQYPN